jgi:hypothetical protein
VGIVSNRALFLIIAAATALAAADEYPEATISNGLITAKLHLPSAEKGYYRGTRFDWSGQISSLKWNGHEYFGMWRERSEPLVHDAIMGPVEEFVTDGDSSVGYSDAKPGEPFIRIGVGAVRKPENEPAYRRFHIYDIVDPGKWTIKPKKDWIQFVHELPDTNGYAYRYTKTIRLMPGKPEMEIRHTLENRGTKPIQTNQYNHNFFVIDGQPTGPGFTVTFPFELKKTSEPRGDAGKIGPNSIEYLRDLNDKETFFATFEGSGGKAEGYDIRVENRNTGAGVRITGDQPITKVIYWSIRSTLSPEPYIYLDVPPGAKKNWNLLYRFYDTRKQ